MPCLFFNSHAQDSTTYFPNKQSPYYVYIGIGTAPFGETQPQMYPAPYAFTDYLQIFKPSLALHLGKKYQRFSWEAGLEMFYVREFGQSTVRSVEQQVKIFGFDERVLLLSAPILAKWTFGQKKWRYEAEGGVQFFFLQHRIENGHVSFFSIDQPGFSSSEPFQTRSSTFLAAPLPRLGTGLSYTSNGHKKYGLQLGVLGVPSLFLLPYAKLLFYLPPSKLKKSR
ncbi:MAG: hypothetical protein Q8J69_09900 [Sphingobacteriaceae bacterium]|nr:hypothetical protein [Sphingobacteriaceae bacterium]